MLVFVVSDSHEDVYTLKTILQRADGAEAVIHLGDGTSDLLDTADSLYRKQVYRIRGNNDSPAYGDPLLRILDLDGVKIMACHGHQYGVRSDLTRLSLAAKENDVKLCLFGHTHVPYCEKADGIWFFNPGAVKNGKYGMFQISKGNVFPVLLSL